MDEIVNYEVDVQITPSDEYRPPRPRPHQMAWHDETSGMTHVGAFCQIETEEPQEYWSKIVMATLIGVVADVSGKAAKALMTVLDIFVKSDGYVFITQEELAKRAGCSRVTMNKVMAVLTDHNVIVRQAAGVYSLNPAFMFQGKSSVRYDTLMLQFVEKAGTTRLPDAPNAASMTVPRALPNGGPVTEEEIRSAHDVPLPF